MITEENFKQIEIKSKEDFIQLLDLAIKLARKLNEQLDEFGLKLRQFHGHN